MFLPLTLLVFGTLAALGEKPAGSIVSVGAKAQSVTISGGTEVLTCRVRPSSEITINGVKAQFSALVAGMDVRVTTNEPGIASKIVATNVAGGLAAAGDVATAKLQALLVDTKWDFRAQRSKTAGVFITFGKEEAYFSDNPSNKYHWKAADGKTIEYGDHRFTFNGQFTEFECPNLGMHLTQVAASCCGLTFFAPCKVR